MTPKELTVRKRLGAVVGPLELAACLLLLVLLRQNVMPGRAGVVLILLLPIAFGLHVTEEFIFPGGFIAWDNRYRPQFADTAGSFYVKVNTIPGVAALLVALGAFDYAGGFSRAALPSWLALAAFMSWNAVSFHLRGALRTRRYSPGMATGLLLFLPLTAAGYVYLLRCGAVDALGVAASLAAALALQPVLDLLKRRGLRKRGAA